MIFGEMQDLRLELGHENVQRHLKRKGKRKELCGWSGATVEQRWRKVGHLMIM